MPTSPIILARAAVNGGQKTPPFLQRKLFNGMDEDFGSGSTSTSSDSSSNAQAVDRHQSNLTASRGRGRGLGLGLGATGPLGEEGEEEELITLDLGLAINAAAASAGVGASGTGSGSNSGSGEEGARVGVVRRPLSRKPNLLVRPFPLPPFRGHSHSLTHHSLLQPKSKSHLRVLSQLRTEDGPADLLEIASEATLHRLSRSGASTIPSLPFSSAASTSGSKPTPNRFPEQAEEEEVLRAEDSSSSAEEGGGDAVSDFGGTMSMGGYGTEDEEERRSSAIWTGFRGTGNGGSGGTGLAASSSALLLGGLAGGGGAAFGRSPSASSEKSRNTEMEVSFLARGGVSWDERQRLIGFFVLFFSFLFRRADSAELSGCSGLADVNSAGEKKE